MLSLFTYGLTFGVAEAQSDTKERGLKLTSFQSFDYPSVDPAASSDSTVESAFFQKLFRRRKEKS